MEDERPDASEDVFAQIFDATKEVVDGAGDAYREAFEEIAAKMPGFEDIVAQAVRLPGTAVSRAGYFAEVLGRKHSRDTIGQAIATTPARAGIDEREILRIAKQSIARDARRTTVLSFAAGIPGGVAAAATIPADLVQFYGYLIRTIQKLAYLYGWRDLIALDGGEADEASLHAIVFFLGVMSGVDEAQQMLDRLAGMRRAGARDQALRAILTAEQANDSFRKVSDTLGNDLARRLAGQVAGKAIPLVGGVVSGVLTGSGYTEMAKRLHKELRRIGA